MAEPDGRIWIDLRLMLDNFGKDADRAIAGLEAKMRPLNALMGRATGAGSATSGAAATDKQTASIVKQTSALKANKPAVLEDWRAKLHPPTISGIGFGLGKPGDEFSEGTSTRVNKGTGSQVRADDDVIAEQKRKFRQREYQAAAAASAARNQTLWKRGSPLTYSGPPPPVMQSPPTTLASMVTNLFTKTLTKPQAMFAGLTTAIAAIRVSIGLWSYALTLAIKPIKMLGEVALHAAENARRLYASSLQSGGLPIAFTQWRQSLAAVLGVGEQEVLQYGRAIAILNKDLQWSNKIIAQTNPTLTAMGWKWKILQQDMHALTASIGYELAPAMNVFTEVMHALIIDLSLAVRTLGDMKRVMDSVDPVHWLLKWLFPMQKAPAPVASMNRLAPSEMERAGLVLGNMGIQSPAVQTARNTAKTVSLLEKFLNSVSTQSAFNVYKKAFGAAMP
jgi:hypothetical protein